MYGLIGNVAFCAVFALPIVVIIGYLLLPFYLIARPNLPATGTNMIYTTCLWLIGLPPPLGLLISFAVSQMIPSSQGASGEPGLNIGWCVVPTILSFLAVPFPHLTLWWLFYENRKMRPSV